MKFKKHYLFLLLPLLVLLCSWGSQGHYMISYRSSYFMPQSLLNTLDWADSLADHASDADYRKSSDSTEAPKHFINIDDFPMFVSEGRIYQTYDSIIQAFGFSFVESKGILPWATEAVYDSLKNSFIANNWHDVVFYASDLGHYVADGHQPLHLTRNYDGQYTGQNGVHSRFETNMINRFLSQIVYSGDTIHTVNNANQYIFNYIYTNYKYVDTVLAADLYAYQTSGSHTSTSYYNAFWSHCNKAVNFLFRNASKAIAELIYTAWIDAGSPQGFINYLLNERDYNWSIYPNPSKGTVTIHYSVDHPVDHINLSIFDLSGHPIIRNKDIPFTCGSHAETWDSGSFPGGVYFVEMEINGQITSQKVVIDK